eukprot:8324303-Pyramimonas_sp.AAC.1
MEKELAQMETTEKLLASQRRHLAVTAEDFKHLDQTRSDLTQKVAKANAAKLVMAESVEPPTIDFESLLEGR